MNQYQPYSMNNNYMPYQNGMYQQPQMYPQQMQNPQMDRLAQLQAMQQSLQPAQMQPAYQGLFGRVVDDFGAITANDVPMNGLGAVFIKKDGSEVQIRSWTANGTIATTSYMPVLEPQNGSVGDSALSAPGINMSEITGLITAISEKVDGVSSQLNDLLKTKTGSKTKKEDD